MEFLSILDFSWRLTTAEATGLVGFVLGAALGYGLAASPRDEKIKELERDLFLRKLREEFPHDKQILRPPPGV